MARLKAKNMAGTTLTADITAAATSFGVANASLLPDCPFRVTIYSPDPQVTAYEIVEVGAKDVGSNTVSSVQRGLEGTTAMAHSAGAYAEAKWTAEMYNELETEAGAQAKADAVNNNLIAHSNETVQQADGVHGLKIEEGTWTPIIRGSSTAGNHIYTTQIGYYIKTGKEVKAYFELALSSRDVAMAGILQFAGFPFAGVAGRNFPVEFGRIQNITLPASTVQLAGNFGADAFNLYSVLTDTSDSLLGISAIKDTTSIKGVVIYKTN